MNIPYNYPIRIRKGVRGLMGDIEFKSQGQDCYIWDPYRIVLTREHGNTTKIDIELEGNIRGAATIEPATIRHMFIKDGRVIWIAKNCNLSGITINRDIYHDHGLERGILETGIFDEELPNKIQLQLYVEHIQFKLAEDVERERAARPQLTNGSYGAMAAEEIRPGQRVETGPDGLVRPATDLSVPYYDTQDRLLIHCTCGWTARKQMIEGDTIEHGATIIIPRISHGGSITWFCATNHYLTVRRSEKPRPEALEDLR